jgi:hypothetical protein
MPPGGTAVQTRQTNDVLFSSDSPLAAAGIFTSEIRAVSGYGQIPILAISDQPFSIDVYEAVSLDAQGNGRFVLTQTTLVSAVVGGQEVISTRISPFGNYMKILLTNTGGAMSALSFTAQGEPV